MASGKRVAVTGLGIVSGLGSGVERFWESCLEGRAVVEPIREAWRTYSPLKSSYWAPLGDWERSTPLLTRLERKQMDPSSRMAVLAAEEALEEAGLGKELADRKRNRYRLAAYEGERCGVFMGTGVGGISALLSSASFTLLTEAKKQLAAVAEACKAHPTADVASQLEDVLARLPTPKVFNTFSVSMAMPNAVSAHLSIKFGLRGPTPTFTCACASGTVALGQAFRAIRDGACEMALAGGTEYLADAYGCCFRGFDAVGALTRSAGPKAVVNRPFDADRSGFLFAEGGGAVLVLEELSSARARGAPLLAEVRGYGETGDAYNAMVMDPEGHQIQRAIEACLADAGLDPQDVDYVNAHGTGTPANDPIECRAVREVFGRKVRVNSTKSLVGHTLGASGAVEAVATVRSLREDRAHGSRNLDKPISDLAFVRRTESFPIRHAVSQSFAFGGQNAVLAFSKTR